MEYKLPPLPKADGMGTRRKATHNEHGDWYLHAEVFTEDTLRQYAVPRGGALKSDVFKAMQLAAMPDFPEVKK